MSLYRITYSSVIPERGNKPIVATGLLAIRETSETVFLIVSYQHGTVYGKLKVPSLPEQSAETQLMIAQFAGQGYILVGADYFGLGLSDQPEGYMVKASHQQATFDMLTASQGVLDYLKIRSEGLLRPDVRRWLRDNGASGEARGRRYIGSGSRDRECAGRSFCGVEQSRGFPRKIDAPWLGTFFILSSFSFENYYSVPGLARSVIKDEYYEASRNAYERRPFSPADVPTDLHKLVRREYFDPQFFAASAYGRLVAETQAYRWVIETPVRNYYGESDEAVSIGLGQSAMAYQHAMGAGNERVQALSTGNTTHRGTFASAVPQWKAWFDALSR